MRCTSCGLPPELCVCSGLPKLACPTKVVVVAHRGELFRSTNTGKLAVRMLQNALLARRGDEPSVARDAGAWVLFPSEDALPLRTAVARGLHTLIVPDGTWTQAKRIAQRDPWCAGVSRVRLEVERGSTYRLRRSRRPDGLCTLEAVAEALRALHGDALADSMLSAFENWVRRAEQVRAGAHAARELLAEVGPVLVPADPE